MYRSLSLVCQSVCLSQRLHLFACCVKLSSRFSNALIIALSFIHFILSVSLSVCLSAFCPLYVSLSTVSLCVCLPVFLCLVSTHACLSVSQSVCLSPAYWSYLEWSNVCARELNHYTHCVCRWTTGNSCKWKERTHAKKLELFVWVKCMWPSEILSCPAVTTSGMQSLFLWHSDSDSGRLLYTYHRRLLESLTGFDPAALKFCLRLVSPWNSWMIMMMMMMTVFSVKRRFFTCWCDSSDKCRTAPSGCWPSYQANGLGLWGCYRLHSPCIICMCQVHVAEGDWPQSKGVAILSFQSLREAELWKDSVPEIRQQDWLDGVDMIIAPVRSMPRTYQFTLWSSQTVWILRK